MFEKMVLGHLVGDYLLQNNFMALNKSKNTFEGWSAALIHCVLYTLAVCLLMWNFDLIWIIAVFLSHFPIDKFGITNLYLHYIKGRSLKDYVLKDKISLPNNRYDIIDGSFYTLVYTAVDNTLHLLIMYFSYKFIYGF